MRVLAFDQATATTGWAFGTENSSNKDGARDRYSFGTITAPKRDEFAERLKIFGQAVRKFIHEAQPDLIAFEEPYWPHQKAAPVQSHYRPASGFLAAEVSQDQDQYAEKSGISPETLRQLQRVAGVLQFVAAENSVPVFSCTPSQWRVTVLGYGRAPKGSDKDYMKKAVLRKLQSSGFDVTSIDASDAIGILIHALHGKEAQARKQGSLLDLAGGL